MSDPPRRPITLDGRFFQRDGKRVFLKAVTFGPFPAGEELNPGAEFARMARSGFNSVRVYETPDRVLLDAAHTAGLTVIASVPWASGQDFLREGTFLTEAELKIVAFLAELGDHPALGFFLVGNEVPSNLVRWMGPSKVLTALEHLIDVAQKEAPDLLVGYGNYPSTEYLEPRNADFTAFNIYLEDTESFSSYARRLQNLAGDRPVLLTEFGLDTERHSEDEQTEILSWHLAECLINGIAGTTLFSWSDRWTTGGRIVDDWSFGLTRRDRSAKPALTHLAERLPMVTCHRDVLTLEETPKFSVVICTYNPGARLRTALKACQALNYPDFEVLVIDDGSTDDTAELIKEFPDVRYIQQEHEGLSVARNLGFHEATGEIIAYTDDDCEPDSDWLFWLARAFDSDQVAAAGGPNIPPEPTSVQEAIVAAGPGAPSHVLLSDTRAEHLPGCNLAIRKEILYRLHGFRPKYHAAGDDVDICWRLIDAGWELAFAPCAFVWHRRRASFPAYLRQQAGYGKAEALLYESHAHRFAHAGIRWEGSVYGGGAVTVDPHAVIYYGPIGEAPYQMVTSPMMPRRPLHRKFARWSGHVLLNIAEFLQPLIRSWSRAHHGGPRPSTFWREEREIYLEDVRHTTEAAYSANDSEARARLLSEFEARGWIRCSGTTPWDLEHHSLRILTATEAFEGGYYIVRIRLLHPRGSRERAWPQLAEAAEAAGLNPIT